MTIQTRYTIDKYSDVLFSIFEKMIPVLNRRENLRFRNSVILNASSLHGMFKRVAALLVGEVNYDSLPESERIIIEKALPDILKEGGWSKIQFEIMYNLMFYDELVVFEYPYTTYSAKCDVCGTTESINKTFKKIFSLSRGRKGKTRAIKAIFECSSCKKKTAHSLEMVKHTSDFKKTPTYTKLFNPLEVEVSEGFGGEHTVWFSGLRYIENNHYGIREGVDMTASQIVNTPLGIIEAILYGENFKFNPNLVTVFKHPKVAGLDKGLAPMMLSMALLMHTGVLRKGREASSFMQMSPNFLITPEGGAASPASSMLDGRKTNRFIMNAVKEIQEGDTNGLSYLPFGVRTTPLFPDQKRLITTNELLAEEANIMQTTGFDNSVLQGGAGILNDPFLLQTVKELVTWYTDQLEKHLNIKLDLMAAYEDKFDISGILEIQDITTVEGTAMNQLIMEYVGNQTLPLSRIVKKFGYKNLEELLKQKTEEQLTLMKHENEMSIKQNELSQSMMQKSQATGTLDASSMAAFTKQLEEQATAYAEELYYMDDGAKKSALNDLQKQNYTLWALTSKKLEDLNYMATSQAKAQMKQEVQ